MSLPNDAERFLRRLRQGLANVDPVEREEIMNELRSHLLDRQAEGKANLLDGFESADDLAAAFVSDRALHGALATGTSWALGRALLVAGRDSLIALFVLLPLVLAHIVALGLLLTAAVKPFMPDRTGLWVGQGSFYAGINNDTAGLHEVLGWWGIPVFAIAGVLLFWVANRAMRALVRRRLESSKSIAGSLA